MFLPLTIVLTVTSRRLTRLVLGRRARGSGPIRSLEYSPAGHEDGGEARCGTQRGVHDRADRPAASIPDRHRSRATVTALTPIAPAARSAAAPPSVAPVVTTSSTSTTQRPRTP